MLKYRWYFSAKAKSSCKTASRQSQSPKAIHLISSDSNCTGVYLCWKPRVGLVGKRDRLVNLQSQSRAVQSLTSLSQSILRWMTGFARNSRKTDWAKLKASQTIAHNLSTQRDDWICRGDQSWTSYLFTERLIRFRIVARPNTSFARLMLF